MELNYSELAEQRQKLFMKLLDNSKEQLEYLEIVEEDAENNLVRFLELQKDWNMCTREIDRLNNTLRDKAPSYDASDEEWRIKILVDINDNLDKLGKGLIESTDHTGESMQNVANQRKVLNAYYGLQRNDQIPLYLDEKK
ncbi:hypothetical protein ACFQ3W_21560 [Paenibacillus puldeungensis]|uniref:Flagellar protein FlgN n=1 Tax=Paenibacillus puldeungensis TaxID=696536 RepID=A0ABW3S2C9_9BACL